LVRVELRAGLGCLIPGLPFFFNVCSSVVSYGEKQRELGEGGRQKKITNFKNTISYFKHFVGREFNDPEVQELLARDAVKAEAMPDGTVGFAIKAFGESKVRHPPPPPHLSYPIPQCTL
jgi:molecular chaperone DnaK (HSP70)